MSIRMEPLQQFFHMVICSSFDKNRNLNFFVDSSGSEKTHIVCTASFFVLE